MNTSTLQIRAHGDIPDERASVDEDAVHVERLIRSTGRIKSSSRSAIIGMIVVVAVLSSVGREGGLVAFVVARSANLIMSECLCRSVLTMPRDELARRWREIDRRLVLNLGGVGVSWGLVALALPEFDGLTRMGSEGLITVYVMLIATFVIVMNLAYLWRALLASVSAMWIVTMVGYVITNGFANDTSMVIGGVVGFVAVMLVSGWQLNRQALEGLRAEVERATLLEALADSNDQLEDALDQALRAAHYDHLTGVRNRRAFHLVATQVGESAGPSERSVAGVIVIDLDNFKAINDTHGHDVGDRVLVHTAELLQSRLRPSDVVARWGGEEFVLLLPGSDLEQTRLAAERMRAEIERRPPVTSEGTVPVTLSAGVSVWDGGERIDDALRRADAATYRAKDRGRNRVEVDRDDPSPVSA